jgi:hypothetical protein
MTPKEAAAECRERSDKAKQEIKRRGCKPGTAERYVLETEHETWDDAAMLIDQIGKPQPWPPPEEISECLVLPVFSKRWIIWPKVPNATWQEQSRAFGGVIHYLPMPPAPEVKG